MALLLIIFIALGAASLLLQGMMYTKQFSRNLTTRILNGILGISIAFLTFTSLPSNYTSQKSIAVALGISALVGLILSFVSKSPRIAKLLLSISVLGGLFMLYFGI